MMTKTAQLIYILLLSLATGLYAQQPIKVLFIEGHSNHDWDDRKEVICGLLEHHGGFNITFSQTPSSEDVNDPEWQAYRPNFSDYDVVMTGYSNLLSGSVWPEQVEEDFQNYMFNGGGFYLIHEGNNAFAHWPEFNRIIGMGWRDSDFGSSVTIDPDTEEQVIIPPNVGGNTGHGPRRDVLVTSKQNHPIHEGFPKTWVSTDLEVYRWARGPAEDLTVLSYAEDLDTGLMFPIDWVVEYGEGRTYASTYGHIIGFSQTDDFIPHGLRDTAYHTTMIRALQWLAGREVETRVPEDFPTPEAFSLRPVFGIEGDQITLEVGRGSNINDSNSRRFSLGQARVDGWSSNMVINLRDTYTNTTSSTVEVTPDEFRFHARANGQPLTPFIVQVNGENDLTVVAIGTTITNYNQGENAVAFGEGVTLEVEPGAKLAVGFLDANADGTGGNANAGGAITYASSASYTNNRSTFDPVYYAGGPTVGESPSIVLGEAPVVTNSMTATQLERNYFFSITFDAVSAEENIEPVAHFLFDDGSGTVATDSSGNGHDGTMTNGVWGQETLDFNGVSTQVTVPSSAFDTIQDEISIAMWVLGGDSQPRADSIIRALNASGQRVLNIHLPWSNSQVYWDAGVNPSGQVDRLSIAAEPSSFMGAWNHWVFTKNARTGVMTIYLNGEVFHRGEGHNASIEGITTAAIGSGINRLYYDGAIDDLAFYNVELSGEAVASIYSATSEGPDLIPVRRYAGNNTTSTNLNLSDSWRSNMVINKNTGIVNRKSYRIQVRPADFEFHASRVGDPVTPFIVLVNDLDLNDYTVIAIGDTITDYELGVNNVPFSDNAPLITLQPNQRIEIGFLDTNADGSGGTGRGVVTFSEGGALVLYSGGPQNSNSGSVTLGEAPTLGTRVVDNLSRDYFVAMGFDVFDMGVFEFGTGGVPQNAYREDSWTSNLIINESDTHVATGNEAVSVFPLRFSFHAGAVRNPLTPFVVKVNGDNDFTVVAVGTTRIDYQEGSNDFAFTDVAIPAIDLAPGEKLAMGFLDAYADGTGGTESGGSITLSDVNSAPGAEGFAEVYVSGGPNFSDNGSVTLGQAPQFGSRVRTDLFRDYNFSITLDTLD